MMENLWLCANRALSGTMQHVSSLLRSKLSPPLNSFALVALINAFEYAFLFLPPGKSLNFSSSSPPCRSSRRMVGRGRRDVAEVGDEAVAKDLNVQATSRRIWWKPNPQLPQVWARSFPMQLALHRGTPPVPHPPARLARTAFGTAGRRIT